ncbi:unnamed protein product [marine sediment metagenome]|uniref:HTH cro/C1-type domain-containing protein n=1 Tax=marine sediment metagenome TaxID=412755 RepID=X0SSC3_9ZZZZ
MKTQVQIKREAEAYLKRTGLKRYELADLARVGRQTVYDLLADRRRLFLDTLLKIDGVINRVK